MQRCRYLSLSADNRKNKPPICELKYGPNALAADMKSDVIAALGRHITVFKGPKACGPKAGSIEDSFGEPVDIASADALTGEIVVANIADSSRPGSVSVCTLSHRCTKNLTNPNMYYVGGVALANDGDCWASGTNF